MAEKLVHYVQLEVAITDGTLSVKAGKFRLSEVDYNLLDDQDFRITSRSQRAWVNGYLVKNLVSEEVLLLVDEVLDDAPDLSYDFNGSPYELLHMLWWVEVPPTTSSLDGLTVKINHIKQVRDDGASTEDP